MAPSSLLMGRCGRSGAEAAPVLYRTPPAAVSEPRDMVAGRTDDVKCRLCVLWRRRAGM